MHCMLTKLELGPISFSSYQWYQSPANVVHLQVVPVSKMQSIQTLIKDFSGDKPLYKAAHIFFLESELHGD